MPMSRLVRQLEAGAALDDMQPFAVLGLERHRQVRLGDLHVVGVGLDRRLEDALGLASLILVMSSSAVGRGWVS